jgi:hypothetical protein
MSSGARSARHAGTRLAIVALFAQQVVTACAIAPPHAYLLAPGDPATPVPAFRYAPVTPAGRDYRPVEPRGWEDVNRDVTPKS